MENGNNSGWIKLHRRLLGNVCFKKAQYIQLWIYILLKANHEESEFVFNGSIVKVLPGQFVTGRKAITSDTQISATTVEDILNFLETRQQIRQLKTNRYRLISVVNWSEYQEARQPNRHPTDIQPTSSRHQADTNKNDKKLKNEEENTGRKRRVFEIPSIEEMSDYFISQGSSSFLASGCFDYYESNGWMVGKNHMKDWQAAARNWIRKNAPVIVEMKRTEELPDSAFDGIAMDVK